MAKCAKMFAAVCALLALAASAATTRTESAEQLSKNEMLVQLLDLQASPVAPSAKRARKFSTFMPMRGRKDGRDSHQALVNFNQLGSGGGSEDQPTGWLRADTEREFDVDTPLLSVLLDEPTSGNRNGWAPAQFASQVQRQLASTTSEEANLQQNLQQQPPALAVVMDAKLRRAFHPMRGKRVVEELYG